MARVVATKFSLQMELFTDICQCPPTLHPYLAAINNNILRLNFSWYYCTLAIMGSLEGTSEVARPREGCLSTESIYASPKSDLVY